ncbi:MAG: hypothetical protein IKI04_02725, partial [Bacilli bacterium]|nr:hypothetical protein [Bacilli bacterium]
TTNVATNSWNIHFANLQIKNGSVAGSPAASLSGYNMNITYGAELQNPGDYYEFTVDVVNEGTLPGKVSIVGLTGNNTEYLSTSYKYSDGRDINIGDILNAGKSKKLTIKAWIAEDIDTSLLPSTDTPITLTFNLQYVQSEEDAPPDATDMIINLAANNSCIVKYNGDVTDEVGNTVTASNVYFDKCLDKRNIIFGGYCWQVIRTTETGGIKMFYNGVPSSTGTCLSSRASHKAPYGTQAVSNNMNSQYLYGDDFTYDISTSKFALVDTFLATFDDTTYESLYGKFTCKNSTGTNCTTLYQVNGRDGSGIADLVSYTINYVGYSVIATSAYVATQDSLASSGYMFNKVYQVIWRSLNTTEYKYGSSFTYSNGTYTLSGTTQNISDWSTGYNSINNTHYTCWNSTGTCTTISYIFGTTSTNADYAQISDGKSINDYINESLFAEDVNNYDSTIKLMVDNWYKNNMQEYTDYLEDAIYCSDRSIKNIGGWDPNGGDVSMELRFKNFNSSVDLACSNETDQFAVGNNKAKLIYPVGLVEMEEIYNFGGSSTSINAIRSTGAAYWSMSPDKYTEMISFKSVSDSGSPTYTLGNRVSGVRPVVSLASGNIVSSGDGSESNPWIIQE